MKKPPEPGPVPNIEYPQIPATSLENGLNVVVVEDSYLPRVSIKFAFQVGRVSNPPENLGLMQLGTELLKEGTSSRSSQEIAEFMDRWAISYETDVLMEHLTVSMDVLENYLEPAMDLLSDILRNPSFPEQEFAKLKLRWRSHLISQRSDPGFLATERLFHTIYPNHPYSKISVPLEHLDRADPEKIRDLYERHISPRGSYLLLAGPISMPEAEKLAVEKFGDWAPVAAPVQEFPPLKPLNKREILLVHRPHSVQTKILVASRTLPRAHPKAILLKVMNQIFGGGASGRLFLNLREDKGYTYGAYSHLRAYSLDGLLMAGASVKIDTTRESLEEIFREMEGMHQAPEKREVQRSKSEIRGSFIRQMETPSSIGAMELVRRLFDFPPDYYARFIPKLQSVTPEEVCTAAQEFLSPDKVVVVVVTDRTSTEEDLKKLAGEIQVYDTLGDKLA